MIDKFLEKFGYVNKSKLTERYLCQELAKVVGDPTDSIFNPEEEEKFFKELSLVHGISEWLRGTAARDVQRFFNAEVNEQDKVKGAFVRTMYIRSRLLKAKDASRKVSTKLEGLRYEE